MTDFTVNFSCAWLLLLLIPVLFLALFPHFRVAKKYRRSRNRITSLVLHCVVSVLAVLVLSGLTFEYNVPNGENEILLLVDASNSADTSRADIDGFVKDVIDYSDSRYKVGVVTFGYDQVYAAPFSYDGDEVYKNYRDAELPDVSATDLESALTYARSLLKYPETSKIVIISDGAETDGKATSVIRNIAADGVHVDTKYVHNGALPEAEIISVDIPDKNFEVGEVFSMSVTVRASYAGEGNITLYDNGENVLSSDLKFAAGTSTVSFSYSFAQNGMHVLNFQATLAGDHLTENNEFTSYVYLDTFNRLLVLESNDGESANLVSILTDNGFNVEVKNVNEAAGLPATVSDLCAYDQVIMMNVAHGDMPDGYDEILNTYVHTSGGGMFTVGGNKIDEDGNLTANMYNREDLFGKTYQRMLPVQAINYTPPLGLQVVIDRSGSMSGNDSSGRSRLDAAKDGAITCLETLSDRDWCGIMSFDTDFQVEIDMTRATQKEAIREAINNISLGGGTEYADAIEAAGENLRLLTEVEKKHIIFITDGQPADKPTSDDGSGYLDRVAKNYENGITMSVVGIGIAENSNAAKAMENMADAGGGYFYRVTDLDKLRDILRDDLRMDEISQYVPKDYNPVVQVHDSVTAGLPDTLPALGGYYGTRLKSEATQYVVGEYVPLYAAWDYGAGKVGSFMCDLRGTEDSWSYGFMNDPIGVKFLVQAITGLLPSKSIRPTDITLELREQNYRNQMSIFTTLDEGDSIDVTVYKVSDDGQTETVVQTFTAGAQEDYSRVTITTKEAGVYRIVAQKKNALTSASIYKTFSYSREYDVFIEADKNRESLELLAALGKGHDIEGASEVFYEFVEKLHRVVDPRLAMIIIALILFLLDIAVRKFKFKWPHELIREYMERKNEHKSA